MSYRDYLKQRIQEIQTQIAKDQNHSEALQRELKSLELKEFEEDLREEKPQVLLKG